ncbi:hypothetical protein GCM10011316_30120 [Roseibium aquae]|uniref:HTH gntR-type domain-containing protein n=1 Tax=Roseibium aquae TaxID=1323746 RepID=A0A916X2T1_9HYPH|nr:GntR family transcriptional regulator [Roseibium aquae]GGB56010.1 hypothetical protein GCM10011316_30120 [Roseibium aquae]
MARLSNRTRLGENETGIRGLKAGTDLTMRAIDGTRDRGGEADRAGDMREMDALTKSGARLRLHERVHRILTEEIASGVLPPGARLMETRVASRFGISRPPARQALSVLVGEGLLDPAGRRGFVVAPGAREAAILVAGQGGRKGGGPVGAFDGGPLEAAASWEGIYDEIESTIVARTAFASWRVIEAELARAYGVSRTVARDVIARLNQRGILRKDGRGHWIAPGLTPDHVGELYELRWVLEPAALVNAFPRIPKDLAQGLLDVHLEALGSSSELDGAALDRLETEIHVTLLGFCGNGILMETLRHYQSLLIAHSFLYECAPQLYPVEPFLPEHITILEHVVGGNEEGAARALEDHLKSSLDRAIHRIAAVSRNFQPAPVSYLQPLNG